MGKIENTIKYRLIESFDPSVLSVINESNMHNAVSYTHLTLPTNREV